MKSNKLSKMILSLVIANMASNVSCAISGSNIGNVTCKLLSGYLGSSVVKQNSNNSSNEDRNNEQSDENIYPVSVYYNPEQEYHKANHKPLNHVIDSPNIMGETFESKYGHWNNNSNFNVSSEQNPDNAVVSSPWFSNKIKIAAVVALSGFGLYKVWSYIKTINQAKTDQESILNSFKKSLTKAQIQKSGINLDKLIKDIKQNPNAILNDKLLDILSPDQLEMAMKIAS